LLTQQASDPLTEFVGPLLDRGKVELFKRSVPPEHFATKKSEKL